MTSLLSDRLPFYLSDAVHTHAEEREREIERRLVVDEGVFVSRGHLKLRTRVLEGAVAWQSWRNKSTHGQCFPHLNQNPGIQATTLWFVHGTGRMDVVPLERSEQCCRGCHDCLCNEHGLMCNPWLRVDGTLVSEVQHSGLRYNKPHPNLQSDFFNNTGRQTQDSGHLQNTKLSGQTNVVFEQHWAAFFFFASQLHRSPKISPNGRALPM